MEGVLILSEQNFLNVMAADIIETNQELTMETALSDIEEWDSLALVSFIAMANTNGKSLNKETIKKATTVRDLYELLQG